MTPDVVQAGNRQRHKPETAGHLADDRIPIAAVDDTAAAIRERLSSKSYALFDPIVVTDGEGRYAGVAELAGVLKASASTQMATLMDPNWPIVTPETDQEHAAEAATAAGVAVLPVVGEDGRPVGAVYEDDIVRHLLAGKDLKTLVAREVMAKPFPTIARDMTLDRITEIIPSQASAVFVDLGAGRLDIITKYDLVHAITARTS